MEVKNKKKNPSRVQGAWGGGGGGVRRGTGNFSRSETSHSVKDSKSATSYTHNHPAPIHQFNPAFPSSPNPPKFVFRAPTADELLRTPDEITLETEGLREISAGPTAASRLRFFPRFFDAKEADWIFKDLLAQLPWQQQRNSKEGRDEYLEPRLTAWFGDFEYRYSGVLQKPHPWTPVVTMIKDRVESVTSYAFNSCLANHYRDGKDCIGWHSDDEPLLGRQPIIASFSFGDVRIFELRKKPEPPLERDDFRMSQTIRVPLPHGSLLIMEGATQEDWQHRVPKEYHDRGPRINLTFRTIFPGKEA